ncbi:MAG: RNA polymerase sigma factor [Firmicutes bacterium]|uniref:RNA polymerase sigma factor n=1 Tax=Candidatus Scybalomonas excrementavium TaxID=2840943 RepID=A0A9D9HZC8_9FIRM|nr:RNA polymerase sigma factor [Candidatus Scybalomonas excrementavium]
MLLISNLSKSKTSLSTKLNTGNRLGKLDENLIVRIAKDDMLALEELYRLTDQTVYAFILSILKNPHDAQDVMQDTYVKIRTSAHLYKKQGKPLAWIFTIARNLCLMKLRTAGKTSDTSLDELEDSHYFASLDQNHAEDRMVLKAALEILSEEDRQIVILHAVSGLKHHEISKSLGIPLSTVLSKYNRSLKKLKKYLIEKESI